MNSPCSPFPFTQSEPDTFSRLDWLFFEIYAVMGNGEPGKG